MGRLRRKPVAETPSADGVWQVPARFNFTRDVVEAFAADAARPALTFVDREGVIDRRTFKVVAADANRWSALLRARGLVPGDRLLVYVGRTPAWHSILLGALKAGLVAVPCPDTLPAADAALRAAHCGARLVVADDTRAQKLAASDVGCEGDVVVVEEVSDELRAHSIEQPTHDTAASDTAFILYTSGTTNDPLGAVHTHGYTWAQRLQAESWLDARPGDLVWCTAGLGTAESIWNSLLGPWSCGVEIAMHEADFDVEQRFDLIARIGVTVLCQGPSEYRLMAKHRSLEGFYIGSVRHAVSTGEPLDRAVAAVFHVAFGLTIYDGYGQTENTILVANSPGAPFRPGSMGLPTLGHEVAVVDDQGNEQPVGKDGDIALRSRPPSLFREYWNAPDETRRAFRGDWYITGDRATRDEDGYLWFTGRVGDAILSAAHRINPFEVESALLEHPSVIECAVVGRPVAGRGNLVKALVILRAGVEPSDELVIELQDHVEVVTAPYKVPREIEFVEELPKTTNGKIRRVELREPEPTGLADTVARPIEGAEEARSEVAEDPALEEARRRKKARSAEVAAAAALEAAARAERRVDLERRTAEALAAEQTAREEEAQQAKAVEQARQAAEEAEAAETRSRRDQQEQASEAVARAARRETERQRTDEEERRKEMEKAAGEQRKRDNAEERNAAAERKTKAERRRAEEKAAAERAGRDEADAHRTAAAKAKEDERQRKEDEKRQRADEKAAAEQARRDEADAHRTAATQAKEDQRQRKEDEKRQREEKKAAAEQARRDEAEAHRTAATQAKEDERQRKEDEKRQREEKKAAAEQARRDEAEARRSAEAKAKEDRDAVAAEQRAAKEALRQEAKSRTSTPVTTPEADGEDDEDRPNPSLLARLSEYGHGKDADDPDPPAE